MDDSFHEVATLLAIAILRYRDRNKYLKYQYYSLDSSSKQSVHGVHKKRGDGMNRLFGGRS